ncbi:hypothetical protein MBLNU13_g03102t1 [Cladosporium sp. NU13]
MAFTSPAVSSQDAAPITPQTTTGASLLSKEKPLNASPGITNPLPESPLPAPTGSSPIPDIRPSDSQIAPLPLGPEPKTSELSHPASEASPPANRTEAIERPPEEQKLAGQATPTGALDIARSPALEEEIPASQAERETFAYWRSGRSQAKRALESLEAVVEPPKEEQDVIGGKSLVEPEKITYWRQGRVVEPAKFAPAVLAAAVSDVLTSQAKAFGDEIKTATHNLEEDLDGGKPLIEPGKITYWTHGRVADPAKYAPAAIAALPKVLESQTKAIAEKLESPFKLSKEEVDGGKALIEPDKITYWSHGRVTDPSKYAPAALAALPSALKDLGQGIINAQTRPDGALPSPQAGSSPLASALPVPPPILPAPSIPPRKAARTYSRSEYSDYRSSTISFHSSHATMSSGQKRPQPDMRNTVYSPYL